METVETKLSPIISSPPCMLSILSKCQLIRPQTCNVGTFLPGLLRNKFCYKLPTSLYNCTSSLPTLQLGQCLVIAFYKLWRCGIFQDKKFAIFPAYIHLRVMLLLWLPQESYFTSLTCLIRGFSLLHLAEALNLSCFHSESCCYQFLMRLSQEMPWLLVHWWLEAT